jgi:hypothetical protein
MKAKERVKMATENKTKVTLSKKEVKRLRELESLISEAISVGEVQIYEREMKSIIIRGANRTLQNNPVQSVV